jgi:hypothetical protein
MQADETVIVNAENCLQLLAHEATRVFHDRLTDQADSMTFFDLLSTVLYNIFKVRLSTVLSNSVLCDAKSVPLLLMLTDLKSRSLIWKI